MAKVLNLKPVEFDALSAKKQAAFQWAGRILLPKYDGCFAMMLFFDGKPAEILSRTGEVVASMEHLFEDALVRYPDIAKTQGGVALLGEAWIPGYEFAELSGMFRRQYPQPALCFAVFDTVQWEGDPFNPKLFSAHPYKHRVELLQRQARHILSSVIPPLPITCESQGHAITYAKLCKDKGGYDGAICSDPNAVYLPGAGKDGEFIKLKPLVSYSLLVVGFDEAVGAKTGRATGCLKVRFKDGGTLGVATGLSEAEQADLASFVGKIIEVEAMGISSKGLLREPRFKGIRSDVTTPDY